MCLPWRGTNPKALVQASSKLKDSDVGSSPLLPRGRIRCTKVTNDTSLSSI